VSQTVFVMHWDVRNAGTGVEVYSTLAGAVQGLIDAILENNGLGEDGGQLTESELVDICTQVEDTQYAFFEDAECYYSISKEEVRP
jgi:hypothetical protein